MAAPPRGAQRNPGTLPAGDWGDAAAELYDGHATAAFAVALLVLGDRDAAARATESAFVALRAVAARGEATRTLLLRQVYAASALLDGREAGRLDDSPGAFVNAVPEAHRETLVLCLNGVPCAELAALEGIAVEIVMLRLHRALVRVRALRRAPRYDGGKRTPP